MSTVIVFGTFDLLHKGHEYFLRHAKRHGKLIVVVARSSIVRKLKGRLPMFSERKRAASVRALGLASKVVLGDKDYSLNVLKKYKPDVICLGYDQKAFAVFLAKKSIASKLIFLKPHKVHIYKSSLLKRNI